MGSHSIAPRNADIIEIKSLAESNKAILDDLFWELEHRSFLFPEGTNETVTFVAGLINTFGTWAEIMDNNSVTLTSKALSNLHISSFQAKSTTDKDKTYIYEIAYGASKVVVATGEILSGTNQISTTQQERMRNLAILAGETIYYRMKCEVASAELTCSFRYHFHD